MLEQLRTVHDQLFDLIEQLAMETREPFPDGERLAQVRLALTRVSLRRNRLLENQVYPWLLARLDSPETAR